MIVGVDARCPECGNVFRTCTPGQPCAACRVSTVETPFVEQLELSIRAERAKKAIEEVFDYEAKDPEITVTALEGLRKHITDLLAEM